MRGISGYSLDIIYSQNSGELEFTFTIEPLPRALTLWYRISTRVRAGDSPVWRIIKLNQEDKLAEFTLRIDGMHCGSCVRRVSQALAATEGLTVEEVRLGAARVQAADGPEPVTLAIAALAKAGYVAQLEL